MRAGRGLPGDHVRRSAEASLKSLGLDTIDLLQLHVWQDDWVGEGDWQEAVEELRAEGKIRWFGISINDHQPANALRAIEAGLVDTVQVIFNVFDQSPTERLFPACIEHDVGVIVRVALDEGGLTGTIRADTEFAEDDFRQPLLPGRPRRRRWRSAWTRSAPTSASRPTRWRRPRCASS